MVSVTNAIAQDQCDLVVDAIDVGGPGKLVFYKTSATTDPATVNDPLQADNTVLAELPFGATAFGDAIMSGTNAVASLTGGTPITDTAANDSGIAGFARAISGSGADVAQFSVTGSVGGSLTADIVVTSSDANATFTQNLPVEIATFTYSQPTV